MSDVLTEQEAFGVEALAECAREVFNNDSVIYEEREFGDDYFYEAQAEGRNVSSDLYGMYSDAGG